MKKAIKIILGAVGVIVLASVLFIAVTYIIVSIMINNDFEDDRRNYPPSVYVEREVGDFNVRFFDDYCEIKGTTAQGNEKKFLTIPAYIDGVRVESLGTDYPFTTFNGTKFYRPEIASDKLEKVYFETTTKVDKYSFDTNLCTNIKKIIYPGIEEYPYALEKSGYYFIYYPRNMYENSEYNLDNRYPANVSYYYNYENSDASDYYWIDDFDYGGTIDNIPTDPVREGYTFDGWYKEAECSNAWDFDTDTLPEEILTEWTAYFHGEIVNLPLYQETILYAKWV